MKVWVVVRARARKEAVERVDSQTLRVSVKEPPVDGKANEAVLRLLAQHYSVPTQSVRLVSGASGKRKLIEVVGK